MSTSKKTRLTRKQRRQDKKKTWRKVGGAPIHALKTGRTGSVWYKRTKSKASKYTKIFPNTPTLETHTLGSN